MKTAPMTTLGCVRRRNCLRFELNARLTCGLGVSLPRARRSGLPDGGVNHWLTLLTALCPREARRCGSLLRIEPRGGRKAMVRPGVPALRRRQNVTLIKAVARAFRCGGR